MVMNDLSIIKAILQFPYVLVSFRSVIREVVVVVEKQRKCGTQIQEMSTTLSKGSKMGTLTVPGSKMGTLSGSKMGTISKCSKTNRKVSGGPFSLISPVTKSGLYYYRNPTSFLHIAAEEVGTPLTVKMLDGNISEDIKHGDILTMHKIFEVVKLECTKPNTGDVIEIPVDIDACVESIHVYDQAPYHTIGDVIDNQRVDCIEWVVVTRGFNYQGCMYHPGTIFQILTDEDDVNEYLAVEMHPGRLMVFLPINIRGEFYKVDSPYETKQQKLIELKHEETPLLITPSLKTFPPSFIQNTGLTHEMLIAERKKTEKLVLASSTHDGECYLHVFPLTMDVFCEILLGGIPVDMLKKDELDKVEKQLLPGLHHQMEYMVSLPYKGAGIDRSKPKLKSKLKKKDIKVVVKQGENDDYPRYTAKPTSLMKELGQTIAGANEAPTIVRMRTIVKKAKYKYNNNLVISEGSSDEEIKDGDYKTVSTILRDVHLEKYEELFLNEKIDFRNLMQCDENDLLELGLETKEADILCTSICQRNSFLSPGILSS